MGTITIDGRKVEFTDEKNLLTIIRKAGIDIPTLCYHSELSTFGACRLCTVEDDRGRTFASCSEEPRDGMVTVSYTHLIEKIPPIAGKIITWVCVTPVSYTHLLYIGYNRHICRFQSFHSQAETAKIPEISHSYCFCYPLSLIHI